jgi:hypothetical protein
LFLITFISTFLVISLPALAADSYTVNSNLRFKPAVSGAQLDAYIKSVYPDSPLVGLGGTWVTVGNNYNIDPVYLMSHAILESGWGFSWISRNKLNLYGWGAYDRDPEGMASPFEGYSQGIAEVAANINSMYLTPGGDYYTPFGPTLRGMNIHYATSKTWADSIAQIMNGFASTIPGYVYPPPFREYDAAYAKIDVPALMQPGTTQNVVVKVTNFGDAVWPAAGEFKLAYYLKDGAGNLILNGFADMPVDVRSGNFTLVTFPITAPGAIGDYTLSMEMSKGGLIYYSQAGIEPMKSPISVLPSSPYYNGIVTLPAFDEVQYAGTVLDFDISAQNVSSASWPSLVTSFGYQWVDAQTGRVIDVISQAGKPAGYIFPGDRATISAKIRVPETPGRYILKAGLVDNDSIWFSSNGSPPVFKMVTVVPDYRATYKLQGPVEPLAANTPKPVYVTVTNNSNMTWAANGQVKLSYSLSDTGCHEGYTERLAMPVDVTPGATITFAVKLTPPAGAGLKNLTFDLYDQGIGWFSENGVPIGTFAAPVKYDMKIGYEEFTTGSVTSGRYTAVTLRVKNTSSMIWPSEGRIKAGYRVGYAPGHQGYILAAPLLKTVYPGETAILDFTISDPPLPGVYNYSFDVYMDGAGWFSDYGNTSPSLNMSFTSNE